MLSAVAAILVLSSAANAAGYCGPGFHRNVYGHCVPWGVYPGGYARPYVGGAVVGGAYARGAARGYARGVYRGRHPVAR